MTLSLYSLAAWMGSRFATVRLGTSSMGTPLLLRLVPNTSWRLDAGSVLMRSTLAPPSARVTAVAQALDVFPTPPFPVKNRYFVKAISLGLKICIYISFRQTAQVTETGPLWP